jgi:hypothetical protein
MTVLDLAGLAVLLAGGWLFLDTLRARDAAVAAARGACDAEGVQLLDDTVAIASTRPARDGEGRLTLRRAYDFEYTDSGDNRLRGSVILLGREVEMIRIGSRGPGTVVPFRH